MSYFKYTGEDNLESMEFAANYNGMLIELLRKNLHPKATTLDFGCGTGFYAELLAKHDFEVIGLELDEQLAKRVGQRGIDCYHNLESIHLPVHQIYSLNVLEHIQNDAEVLKALYDGLENDGIAVFYVPAHQFLYSQMDRHVEHFRRYSKRGLQNSVEEAGFEISKIFYVDSLGFFAAVLYKLLPYKSGKLSRSSVMIYDRFIFPISKKVDLITKKFLGKNLLVVAHKKLKLD